jgi:hypothetical protein
MKVIWALIFSLLLAATALSQSGPESKSSQQVAAKLPPPKVAVDSPLDSPLSVRAWTSWTNAKSPGIELDVEVKNVSEKAIRAYATRSVLNVAEEEPSCFLLNATKPGKVLQPGQSEVRTTWRYFPADSQKPLSLWLDFVEFTDDSAWGTDRCESAQHLAGLRAGARAYAARLEQVFSEEGAAAVMKRLNSVAREMEVPVAESQTWQKGFQVGIDSMMGRLRQVMAESGLPEIGPTLKQPIDASGYKIEIVRPESP